MLEDPDLGSLVFLLCGCLETPPRPCDNGKEKPENYWQTLIDTGVSWVLAENRATMLGIPTWITTLLFHRPRRQY